MPYATVSDVQALDPNAKITMNSAVTRDDVVNYLHQVGAEVNGILAARGYAVPVPGTVVATYLATPPGGTQALPTFVASAVSPVAFDICRRLEAAGAHALLERGWPDSPLEQSAMAAWLSSRDMLKAGQLDLLDAPFNLAAKIASATAGASSL
jgi:hypothetical protein